MSNTLGPLPSAKITQSTQTKPSVLSQNDLQLVAERLALIQGHISHMPATCISGVVVMDGFLLVAFNIPGHTFEISVSGAWLLDKKSVVDYATNKGEASE